MIDQAIGEATRLRDTDYSIHFHVFLPQDVVRSPSGSTVT